MANKFKSEHRYFVRWRTTYTPTGPLLRGWEVCDREKFDNIAVAAFMSDERSKADAICKLLNSNEEVENGLSK